MKRQLFKKTLRSRIIVCFISVMLSFVILLVVVNAYAIQVIRNYAYSSTKEILYMHLAKIQTSLEGAETFLASLSYENSDLLILEKSRDELEWSLALSRLQRNITKALPSYGSLDGMFVFCTREDDNVWVDTYRSGTTNAQRLSVKARMTSELNGAFAEMNAGHWFSLEVDGKYVFLRVLRFRETYAGAWVYADSLLDSLKNMERPQSETLFFCDDAGFPLDRNLENNGLRVSLTDTLHHYTLSGNGKRNRYLMIAEKSPFGPFALVAMVRDNNILEGLDNFMPVIWAAILGIIYIAAMLAVLLRRWLIKPLQRLTVALRALQNGDLSVHIDNEQSFDEFVEVNNTVNGMIGRIEELKIDVYEEKLARQNVQLLYLQQQLKPHLLINCLNTIFGLAQTGRNDLVQKLSLDLSHYLRYTLSDHILVTLRDECEHVKTYVELSTIRFGDSVECDMQISEEALDRQVPPLLLQTFIENTIKHEVENGKITTAYIRAEIMEDGRLYIGLWDTGDGFSEEMLHILDTRNFTEQPDKRIGLANVIQRLYLIYGKENVDMRFSNRENAGAQAEFWLRTDALAVSGKVR